VNKSTSRTRTNVLTHFPLIMTVGECSFRTPPRDMPKIRKMPAPLYAADTGPPCIDWSMSPTQPIKCPHEAIKPFRQRPTKVDEVLTAFALDIYKTMVHDALYSRHLDFNTHARATENHFAFFRLS